MKTFLTILSVLAFINSYSQDLDSLKQKILAMELNQEHIQLNLTKSHKEFGYGAIVTLAGAIMSAVYVHGRSQDAGYEKPVLLYAGAGVSLVGACIMVDSHKYIGRAGERVRLK